MKTMLAAVLHDFDQLELERIPASCATEIGDVVVRVHPAAIPAHQHHKAIKGIRRNVSFPTIVGHEPSGVVAEIAWGVSRFAVGGPRDRPASRPTAGSVGTAAPATLTTARKAPSLLHPGGDGPPDVRPGAFAEYLLTKESSLFAKPESISFDAAAIAEPLAGAWKGVIQYSEMTIGDDVVVIGVGSIGLLCLLVAKARRRGPP